MSNAKLNMQRLAAAQNIAAAAPKSLQIDQQLSGQQNEMHVVVGKDKGVLKMRLFEEGKIES